MKKLFVGAALLSMSSFSFAAETGPGCGLGSQFFKGQSGVMSHVLAATTNGSSGNQTFGMTSGTMGCNSSQTIQLASLYMDTNVDRVAADMARGEGESLNALAELIGVASEHKSDFNRLLKTNFGQVFNSSDTSSREAIDNILALMQDDEVLKVYVS